MQLETSSNLFGTTVNPFNTKLTCGGSSGGEGALIGLRGMLVPVRDGIYFLTNTGFQGAV
jgi:Asp-tRNA(Asn)/Glu-tRNA(Gln) amidotransferase A subunit family amidase